jgi:hypothetical protein
MTDYVECPFCDRIYPADSYPGLVHTNPLDAHIRTDHGKVKLRKGSNYRWVDRAEVLARLAVPVRRRARTRDERASNPAASNSASG